MSYDKSKSAETALSDKTAPSKKLLGVFEGKYTDIRPGITRVLDFGAGKGGGRHSIALRKLGYTVYSYDPYNGALDADPLSNVSSVSPDENARFGVVFTAFVLNVVDYPTMLDVLRLTEQYTAQGGYTIHIVREDLRHLRGSWEINSKGTYQRDIPIEQLTDLGYTRRHGLFIKHKG